MVLTADILIDELTLVCHQRPSEDITTLPFFDFCEQYLLIQNKDGDLEPLVPNAIQRDLINTLSGRDLVLKARQKGVSTIVQAWHYYHVLKGGEMELTLCHDDDLTSEVRAMVDRFHENMPDAHQPRRKYANATVTTYPELNSRARIATVGGHSQANSSGKRKGRGGTNTRIHGTEVAFWPDLQGVMSAAMQTGNPAIILESTPNGMVGAFYEWCMQALAGQGIWTLHFYPWFYDDEYRLALGAGETLEYTPDEQVLVDKHRLSPEQIQWRRRKKLELPHTFEQEYPEDPYSCFLASGQSYFRNIEHVFVAPPNATPEKDHRYYGGLDFAQTSDYLSLSIFDATTRQQVDRLRVNNLPWQEMRRLVSSMANKWNAFILGESNSMGSTNIELLQSGETLSNGGKIAPVQLMPFQTTATSKPPLIQALYHALHEQGYTLLDTPDKRHEYRAFISRQTQTGHWVYEAGGGATDDGVISDALAIEAINTFARSWIH